MESKGTVSPGIAEPHDFNLDGNVLPAMKEIEGTAVDEMSPNTPVGMALVVKVLVTKRLLCIR